MKIHPFIDKLLCVALVVSLMIPLGQTVFPYLNDIHGGLEFRALEAVVSTTIGFGIHDTMFG